MSFELLSVLIGLIISTIALVFTAYQTMSLRKQLEHSANIAVYNVAFAWDKMLIENPAYYKLLENPNEGDILTPEERVLVEYRIDIMEFLYSQNNMQLYGPEDGFLKDFVRTPLIKKAFKDERIKKSIRTDFYNHCLGLIEKYD